MTYINRLTIYALIALACLPFGSCAPRKMVQLPGYQPQVYAQDHAEFPCEHIRRVVLLVPENSSGANEKLVQDIQQCIAETIRKRGLFEVIQVRHASTAGKCNAWIRRGEFPISLINQMKSEHNADAVIFVGISRVQTVAPVSADVSLRLVDAEEGIAVRSIDGHWSLDDPAALKRAISLAEPAFAELDPLLVAQSLRALVALIGADIGLELSAGSQNCQ